MKFITEDDLRDLYKKEPFTTYELEPGCRLTPGARQFLVDRGMNMFEDEPFINRKVQMEKKQLKQNDSQKNWKKNRLKSKINSTNALFLAIAEELLSRDVCLAQKVVNLSKQFSCINSIIDGKETKEGLCCQECTGIKADNFSSDIGDCFEITDFHLKLEKGREIISLHRLRCSLQEIEPVVLELFDGSDEENLRCEELMGKVNEIINTLSQMICSAFGGEKCQKQS